MKTVFNRNKVCQFLVYLNARKTKNAKIVQANSPKTVPKSALFVNWRFTADLCSKIDGKEDALKCKYQIVSQMHINNGYSLEKQVSSLYNKICCNHRKKVQTIVLAIKNIYNHVFARLRSANKYLNNLRKIIQFGHFFLPYLF